MMGSAQVFDIEELNEERAEFRGKQKAILQILAKKLGNVPESAKEQILDLNTQNFERLIDRILEFRSVQNLTSWLVENQPKEKIETVYVNPLSAELVNQSSLQQPIRGSKKKILSY
jgi:Domain of unknown function (DUF4351)